MLRSARTLQPGLSVARIGRGGSFKSVPHFYTTKISSPSPPQPNIYICVCAWMPGQARFSDFVVPMPCGMALPTRLFYVPKTSYLPSILFASKPMNVGPVLPIGMCSISVGRWHHSKQPNGHRAAPHGRSPGIYILYLYHCRTSFLLAYHSLDVSFWFNISKFWFSSL